MRRDIGKLSEGQEKNKKKPKQKNIIKIERKREREREGERDRSTIRRPGKVKYILIYVYKRSAHATHEKKNKRQQQRTGGDHEADPRGDR